MRKLIFLSLLLVIGIQMGYGQDEDLPPYLYYYSDVLNAFVIERADGTDSRIFIDEVQSVTNVPGWSPSGEWFAYHSAETYVVSLQGEPSEFVNGIQSPRLSWSPTADMLFVVDASEVVVDTGDASASYHRPTFSLIDMSAHEMIVSFELELPGMRPIVNSISEITWSSNGEFLAFFYLPHLVEVRIVTVTIDGRIEEFELATSPLIEHDAPDLPSDLVVRLLPEERRIAVHNPLDNSAFSIDAPFES